MGLQLSELELSESNSDSSVGSILGVRQDGFDGDAWMSDAEGAQDEIQVGAAAGINDHGDIPLRTTAWSAGAEDVVNCKTVKGVGESRQQASAVLGGKTVTFDLQGTALSENDWVDGEAPRRISVSEGSAAGGATLTREENRKLKRQERNKVRSLGQQKSASAKGTRSGKKRGNH